MSAPAVRLVPLHSDARVMVTRPDARYAVVLSEGELRGTWVRTGLPLPEGHRDTFTLDEGRLLLPFLRARTGGRPPSPATTPHGRLIDRVCRKENLSAEQLAAHLGVDKAQLSRARHGTLPEKHVQALQGLLARPA